jgi:hemerythrin
MQIGVEKKSHIQFFPLHPSSHLKLMNRVIENVIEKNDTKQLLPKQVKVYLKTCFVTFMKSHV